MSTRASIHYSGALHIFIETNTDDICIDFEPRCYEQNEFYNVPVLKRKELEALYLDLKKYFEGK